MSSLIFTTIIAILVLSFILERILEYLNYTRYGQKLPREVKDVYDDERYAKAQQYNKVNYRFSTLTSSFSFLLIIGMLYFEGFAFVDHLARQVTTYPVGVALVFFGILMAASDLLNTPFALYDVFVIEEKFGFNKTSPKTFMLDKLKNWMLAIILGGGILALIVWIYEATGPWFWIIGWGVVSLFSIFMSMFYSTLIVPLFNKQTPLEEGELRHKIEEMSQKAGFKLQNIFVIDSSKRSTKANAYFSGLGPKKRIVLFDTLIEDLDNDEIVSVLAHEIGHYKKKHTLQSMLISILHTGLVFFLLSLLVDNPALSKALGAEQSSFHLGLITFGILYSPISLILGLAMNMLSRKNEYQADRFAARIGWANDLIRSLKKLSGKNLSNLTPHPAYVFVHYSHPPLISRIKALKNA